MRAAERSPPAPLLTSVAALLIVDPRSTILAAGPGARYRRFDTPVAIKTSPSVDFASYPGPPVVLAVTLRDFLTGR